MLMKPTAGPSPLGAPRAAQSAARRAAFSPAPAPSATAIPAAEALAEAAVAAAVFPQDGGRVDEDSDLPLDQAEQERGKTGRRAV